jgi:hypothetical protein
MEFHLHQRPNMLTQQGMKYVGGDANTVPFEFAPAVCKARDLIQKRIKQALGISAQFNEVLRLVQEPFRLFFFGTEYNFMTSAAYMERQKMAVGILHVCLSMVHHQPFLSVS